MSGASGILFLLENCILFFPLEGLSISRGGKEGVRVKTKDAKQPPTAASIRSAKVTPTRLFSRNVA